MLKLIEKPKYCIAVNADEGKKTFERILSNYDGYIAFQNSYERKSENIYSFYIIDDDGHPFAALALYNLDVDNRNILISCVAEQADNSERLRKGIQWVTDVAILKLGMEKVSAFISEDLQEQIDLFHSSGYSFDGFLRDHLLLSNGKCSDAFLISILKHVYERQHLLHCKVKR